MRLGKKVRAGCEFVQTQGIYNLEKFSKWMEMVRDRGLHAERDPGEPRRGQGGDPGRLVGRQPAGLLGVH